MAILEKYTHSLQKIFTRTAKGDGHPANGIAGFMGSETSELSEVYRKVRIRCTTGEWDVISGNWTT
jgi:hypothetical protein